MRRRSGSRREGEENMVEREAPMKPRPAGAPHPRRPQLGRIVTRQRAILAGLALFAGIVAVNAVVLQNDRHPAPLFRTLARGADGAPLPPLRPDGGTAIRQAAFTPVPMGNNRAERIEKPADRGQGEKPKSAGEGGDALVAEIQRELARRGLYKGEADGRTGPMTVQAIRDFQFGQRLPVDGRASEELLRELSGGRATMKDELLDLLRKSVEPEKPNRTVLDVQRALNKAGYGPLTEDGQLGPSTRAAIAKFETDRKLPPKGEPKGPVLQALAAATGIAIAR
jgi:peptidoglycan hydrolase-like protein with peptidoglycan-binding domain